MSPLPRQGALRGPAVRQVRFAAFVGAVGGAGGGVVASHRLPGGLLTWVACGAAAGLLAGLLSTGAALVASGLHWRPWLAGLIGLALLGWTGADGALSGRASPPSFVGGAALWPADFAG